MWSKAQYERPLHRDAPLRFPLHEAAQFSWVGM